MTNDQENIFNFVNSEFIYINIIYLFIVGTYTNCINYENAFTTKKV